MVWLELDTLVLWRKFCGYSSYGEASLWRWGKKSLRNRGNVRSTSAFQDCWTATESRATNIWSSADWNSSFSALEYLQMEKLDDNLLLVVLQYSPF